MRREDLRVGLSIWHSREHCPQETSSPEEELGWLALHCHTLCQAKIETDESLDFLKNIVDCSRLAKNYAFFFQSKTSK